ncbi:two component transcriptional regulator, winged helix family [Leptolyngbya sp. NIES-3755]|nr:two component transcriptional regulator, winged helix family [Leptolyngbya sp. NIES-3755]
MRLLFVEDDVEFSEQLSQILKQHYAVDIATDGETAWKWLQLVNYDAVILDVMLPKLNGVELCQRIRDAGQQVRILLLTGQSTIDDRIIGLDSGADDYLIKPVGFQEVLARLRALLRRPPFIASTRLEWGSLQLDLERHQATFAGKTIVLTLKEYLLLKLFLRHGDWVHKHSVILEQLWDLDCDLPSEEAVRAHVKGLRRKLKAVGAGDLIETVYGVGYRLNPAYLTPTRSTHPTVLVVAEQEPAETMKELLEPCGLSIALSIEPAALLKTLDLTQPNLLVLAADATGLNRFALCQVIRRDRRWNWLPIVLMMATTDPEIINQGFAAGADDFVHDPIIPDELTNRVLNRLERVRQLQKRFQTG